MGYKEEAISTANFQDVCFQRPVERVVTGLRGEFTYFYLFIF